MVKISFLLFASGLAVGWGVIIAWGLVWAFYGFWWGIGAATLSLLAAVRYVLFPLINWLERRIREAIALFDWSGKHWICHGDLTAPNGTYRGTARSLARVYWREWTVDEQIEVLRDLKAKGQARGRNPDNGRTFAISTDRLRHDHEPVA